MATVLDEFVITLGLDPAKFDAGQRKAADSLRKFETEFTRRTKNIEQSGEKTLDFFEGIKRIAAFGFRAVGSKSRSEPSLSLDETSRRGMRQGFSNDGRPYRTIFHQSRLLMRKHLSSGNMP